MWPLALSVSPLGNEAACGRWNSTRLSHESTRMSAVSSLRISTCMHIGIAASMLAMDPMLQFEMSFLQATLAYETAGAILQHELANF